MNKRLFCLLGSLLVISSCSIHKIDVQQGNVLKPETVAQIKPGMSRDQVQFLLGNPAIKHPFDHDRWDYPFTFKSGKKGSSREHYKVTVFFDGDQVQRIETDLPDTP